MEPADAKKPRPALKIVGLAGRKRSGKDTAAALLAKECDVRLAFADPLKQMAAALWGFSHAQLHGDLKEVEDERWGIKPRTALQKLGTDLVRKGYRDDAWLKNMEMRLERAAEAGAAVVFITDVRFPNEAEFVRARGGVVIQIRRAQVEAEDPEHESEKLLPPELVHREVRNDGTVAEFEQALRGAVVE